MTVRRAVYSVSIGVPEPQPPRVEMSDGVEMYFITDKPTDARDADKWTIVPIEVNSLFRRDMQIEHRRYKFKPDICVPLADSRIYLDPTVEITGDINKVFAIFESRTHDFTFMRHSFRRNIREEFIELFAMGYDFPVTLFDSFHFVGSKLAPTVPVLWGGIFWHRKSPDAFDDIDELVSLIDSWSVRDQLWIPLSVAKDEARCRTIVRDNRRSEFHSWPRGKSRNPAWRRLYGTRPLAFLFFALQYVSRKIVGVLLFSRFSGGTRTRSLVRRVLVRLDLRSVWATN